jgi:hypothetical protein
VTLFARGYGCQKNTGQKETRGGKKDSRLHLSKKGFDGYLVFFQSFLIGCPYFKKDSQKKVK